MLGVFERDAGTEIGVVRVLSVVTEAGTLESMPIEDGATVTILDPTMQGKIVEAVEVAGKAKVGGARRVEIALSGNGRRDVRISYVVSAPVWKTSYRLVDGGQGKANLQAWAVIENALGEDWNGVTVTLSSGAPVALRQRLHQAYWRDRPEAPVPVEGVGMPDLDQGTVAPKADLRFRLSGNAAPVPPLPAPMSSREAADASYDTAPAALTAGTLEGDVSANFSLRHPVNLQAGRTLSVAIIDTEVEAERIALWTPGKGIHPVAALMIRNGSATTLPPGLITIYDRKAGYLGDARLPSTPVNEQRLASFAVDRKVKVQAETKPSEVMTKITVVDGVARLAMSSREVTSYTVKGAEDAPRSVIIEHPRRNGWTFTSEARDSETPTAYRLKVAVPAGGSAQVQAVLEHVQVDTYGLIDADAKMLLSWGELASDPKLASNLTELSLARSEVAAAERQVAEIGEREEKIVSEQARIRSNLGAVPKDSELARRYLAQLGAQEDDLGLIAVDQHKSEDILKSLQEKIRNIITRL